MITLPIDAHLGRITSEVMRQRSLILTASPGAGKTTRLPPRLLDLVKGKVVVLQPRRMAAVAACQRICEEQGWEVGAEAGYQVRFESKISSHTRLIFMTDALLLRQMLSSPELTGIDLLVIDEFHERNLNQDLLLGAVRELQELGSPIKLVVMSATLDIPRLQKFLEPCSVYDVPGLTFPLEIRYSNQALSLRTDYEFVDRVAKACVASADETDGDILVFLPGVGEISRVENRLLESGLRDRDIFALHGSLSLKEQQAILRPSERKRIILCTNVAEASVTVPGVDRVIDTGLAKVMETNSRTGFSRLELERIALFNARQRSGRAARERSGVCLRLWTSHEEVTQAEQPVAECQRADLSQALLFLAHLGVSDFIGFSWLTFPPGPLFQHALRSLKMLGALSSDNRLTDFGRQLLDYPVAPRWGAVLARSEKMGEGRLGAAIVALMGERDIVDRERGRESRDLSECDVTFRLSLLEDFQKGRGSGALNRRGADAVLQVQKQLEGLVAPGKSTRSSLDDALPVIRELLLTTQSDRLCRRRKDSDRALMVGGRGVKLSPQSQVRESEFFVALQGVDLPGQNETVISMATGFDKDLVLRLLKDKIETKSDVFYDDEKDQFYARRGRFFQDLPIDEPTLAQVASEDVAEAMVKAMQSRWDLFVSRHDALKTWLERLKFLSHHRSDYPPNLSDLEQVEFLEMACFGKTKMSEVLNQDLVALLEQVVSPELVKTLNRETPAQFVAPTGTRLQIHYQELHSAYVEVRLQEMFGVPASPKLVFGQLPLTFRLLAPNFRPVQITSDLASFWKNGYPEVRKELRIRYSKHSWPDDPLTAKPEAKGRRR